MTGTVLAFDFGEKRIGVAVGELGVGLAHPLTVIDAMSNARRFALVEELIREWRPVLLVVGLPAHANGTEHEVGRLSRQFARRLSGRFKIETVLVDERLSSAAAREALCEARTRVAKARVDELAAREILQTFFTRSA
jgi:putative Holliday junction resolvase